MQTTVQLSTHQRTMPELSDVALFACAAGALWFVRRALRRRLPRRSDRD